MAQMKRETISKNIMCVGIAMLYCAFSFPAANLQFPDGFSALRLTGLLPVVAGLIFGVKGAVACAVGNFLADAMGGLDAYWALGILGNFLGAWIPYKLWHSLFRTDKYVTYLGSPNSVLKFAFICVIGACVHAGCIASVGHLLGAFTFRDFFFPVALQYYELSVIGGMLIFQIGTSVLHIVPHIPQKVYEYKYKKQRYYIDYVLCFLIAVLALRMLFIPNILMKDRTIGDALICVFFLISVFLLSVLPFTRSKEKIGDFEYKKAGGLKAQFITIFLIVINCFFVFFVLMCFRLLNTDFKFNHVEAAMRSVLWFRVILSAAAVSTVFLIMLSVILKIMHRKVIEPLCLTSNYAAAFAEGTELIENSLCLSKTGNELDSLGQSVNRMVGDIRSYVEDIRIRTAKEEHMVAQLMVARTIQMGMLPDKWCGTGFGIVPYIKPAKEVGGDFYYFNQKHENSVFVCIADVSGKDISAAMFMARTKTLLEAYTEQSLGKMMEGINQALAQGNDAFMFVTLFAAVIDKTKQTLSYVNAGHNAPIYYDRGTTSWLINEPDLVLGIRSKIKYQEHVLNITEAFRLFIYTDGVSEAEDVKGGFFGNDRIIQIAAHSFEKGDSDAALIHNMDTAVHEFMGDSEQTDDITMMTVSIKN